MAFFFPAAHREIDWTQPHDPLEQELQEITPASEQGRRVADKLFKVRRTNGQVEWVLVHIEFQSQPEADFAKRMYVYNYRLFDRYNQRVASFAILGDDRPEWRPDRFAYELWGTEVGIRFPAAKLLDYARDEAALESSANPIAVVVLAHLQTLQNSHDDESRRLAQVRLVKGLYERGYSAEQVRQLYQLMERMMTLPKPLAELVWNEIHEFEKEKGMTFITTAKRVGLEKGLAEGLAEGLEKGREEGREEGLLAGIELGLKLRFAAEGLALMPEIRQIQDADLLQQVLASIEQADTPDAVRQVWRSANRPARHTVHRAVQASDQSKPAYLAKCPRRSPATRESAATRSQPRQGGSQDHRAAHRRSGHRLPRGANRAPPPDRSPRLLVPRSPVNYGCLALLSG